MNVFFTPLLLISAMPLAGVPSSKVPIGKETTYVDGPLAADGSIDYEAALNQRLAKGITPDKNAVALLWKAIGPKPGGFGPSAPHFKRLGIEEPPANGPYFIEPYRFMKDTYGISFDEIAPILDDLEWARRRPWTENDYPRLAAWLKANKTALATAAEAVRRPGAYQPNISTRGEKYPYGTLLSGFTMPSGTMLDLANAWSCRAMLRLGEGRPNEAWHDLFSCHRLSRVAGRSGTFMDALGGMALDEIACEGTVTYLDRGGLNAKQLQNCLDDLSKLPSVPLADAVDLSERLILLDQLQALRRGGAKSIEKSLWGNVQAKEFTRKLLAEGPLAIKDFNWKEAPPEFSPREREIVAALDWEPAFRACNRWHDRMVDALRIADRPGRDAALRRLEIGLALMMGIADPPKAFRAELARPNAIKTASVWLIESEIASAVVTYTKVQDADDRVRQRQRHVRLAVVLSHYRREHGRYPAALDDVTPKYLRTLPEDLYSGERPIYRLSEKGFVLYSVGKNGQDDGGRGQGADMADDQAIVQFPQPELKKGN
jgi:hypothetical protein